VDAFDRVRQWAEKPLEIPLRATPIFKTGQKPIREGHLRCPFEKPAATAPASSFPALGTLWSITMIAGSRRWLPASAGLFVYGNAGGGWVGYNSLAITNLTTGTCGNFNNFGNCSNSTGGWLVGAGFEYAFTNN
jgi:hypothetical protein